MAENWYYSDTREQRGPVSLEHLRQLVQSGRLLPDDLVWREGMREWIRADLVSGLFDTPPRPLPPPALPPVIASAPLQEEGVEDDTTDLSLSRGVSDDEGPGGGVKLALVVGGISLTLILLGLISVSLLIRPGGGGTSEKIPVRMRPGQGEECVVTLRQGEMVRIEIRTTADQRGMADVDCDVMGPGGEFIVGDHLPAANCFVQFQVFRSGPHRLRIQNVGAVGVQCEVIVRR